MILGGLYGSMAVGSGSGPPPLSPSATVIRFQSECIGVLTAPDTYRVSNSNMVKCSRESASALRCRDVPISVASLPLLSTHMVMKCYEGVSGLSCALKRGSRTMQRKSAPEDSRVHDLG